MNTLELPKLEEVSVKIEDKSVSFLTDFSLYELTHTLIAFSNRLGGNSAGGFSELNLSYDVGDEENNVSNNRNIFINAVQESVENNDELQPLINPIQVHGTLCLSSHEYKNKNARLECDAIFCNEKQQPVMLLFADCVPVIAVAPSGDFALIHSGWRGCYNEISKFALAKMQTISDINLSECNFYIGPHIGVCCFETSTKIASDFADKFGQDVMSANKRVDLSDVVCKTLISMGATKDRIVDADICSVCHNEQYFSYRAQNQVCGRQCAFAVSF